MTRLRRLGPWVLLAAVVVAGLALAATHPSPPPSLRQRTLAIARDIRCPSCEDLNAAQSNALGALAVRQLIRADLQKGMSATEIDAYLVARYGPDIILEPPAHGADALVWWLPAVAAVLGLAGGALALRRWRPRATSGSPGDEDRRLVEQALRELS